MGQKYQYCREHKKMEDYPACETEYTKSSRFARNTQLPVGERPVVWQHPVTGEIRYPGHTGDMPGYYKDQGYERKEFTSYQDHKKFCDSNGLVNHAVEGIRVTDNASEDGN